MKERSIKFVQNPWFLCVLVFYWCISNHQKLSSLKQDLIIGSKFMHVQHGLAGFSAQGITRLKSRLARLCSCLGSREKSASEFILDGIQLFGCKTEGPVSLLVVTWGLPVVPRGYDTPYHVALSILKSAVVYQILFMPEISIFFCL